MTDNSTPAVIEDDEENQTDKELDDTPVHQDKDIPVDQELLTEDELAAMADDGSEPDYEVDEGEEGEEEDEEVVLAGAEPAPNADAPVAEAHQPFVSQDFEAKAAALAAAQDAIKTKWEDGDIGDEDYHTELAANVKASARLEIEQESYTKAKAADDEAWGNSVNGYKEKFPDLWGDTKLNAAFNAMVGDVTSNPIYARLPFEQQLAKAHSRLAEDAELLGLANVPAPKSAKKPAKAADEPAEPKAAAPAARKQRGDPPPTLARMPSSDMNEVEDGRFAQLDRLAESGNPEAMERALSRLSPEEREAWGSGAGL